MENKKPLFVIALMAITLLTSTILSAVSVGFAQSQQTKYPYTIVVVGDWDCNADTKKTIANIQSQNPDLILSLGDMSYTKSAGCWLDEIAPIKDKMLITQGNHDDNYDDYLSAFGITGLWYSKEFPEANALLVSANTEESLKAGSEQLTFIEKALTDSNAAWKIVFMHKPSITYGHHSSDEGAPETLLPLYDKTKTSIEFSGHNHFMQEIYPTVNADGSPLKAAAGEGTVHIVSGGGGRDLYDFEENAVVAQSNKDHGIVKVTLLDNKNAKAEFISNDGAVTQMADIINRNSVGPIEPPTCQAGTHLENGVCVIDVVEPPVEPPATTGNTTQILISNNIKSADSIGQYNNSEYTDFYNAKNLFDNLTNTWSFWSQYGLSSFNVELDKGLNKLLCKAQINAYNPQNQSYTLRVENSEDQTLLNFNGTLDSAITNIDIQGCITDVDQLGMQFNTPEKWVTLSELKLFSNSSVVTPPVEPCLPGWHLDPALNRCIEDVPVPPTCEAGTHLEDNVCVTDPVIPPPTPEPTPINGSINIINSSAVIKALNTNFTIIFYDNDTSSEWENNDTDLNETEIDNSPIQFSSNGGEY